MRTGHMLRPSLPTSAAFDARQPAELFAADFFAVVFLAGAFLATDFVADEAVAFLTGATGTAAGASGTIGIARAAGATPSDPALAVDLRGRAGAFVTFTTGAAFLARPPPRLAAASPSWWIGGGASPISASTVSS